MRTGCSPYDLARLCDEYPAVFDEYVDMYFDAQERLGRKADMEARRARVGRIFDRGRR